MKNHHLRRDPDATFSDWRRSAPGASRHDWFADEVAIDFPSIGAAVNRIREGFLGLTASTPPLSAELLLTPMEAFRGVKVPLAVPIRGTCRVCGGRGESWMEICSSCSGRGDALTNHRVQISVPPRVRHGARFRFSVASPSAPATHVEVRISIQ